MPSVTTLLVLTTLPDRSSAEKLARELVEARLAACVNVLASCHSIYRWQGTLETAEETPLLIKTSSDRYPALEAAILDCHPYQLPEVLALSVVAGLPAYLAWVDAETRHADDPQDAPQ